ncbi:MAG: DUF1499 domain-containing protein, partial [Gammaproteobacteria bacterium]
MKLYMLLVKITFAFSMLTIILFPLASLGARFSLWHYSTAFQIIKVEVILGLIVVLSALALLICAWVMKLSSNAVWMSLSSILVIGLVIVPLLYQFYLVNRLPKIHDITTDWEDPPQFEKIVDLRPANSNTLEYAGESIAAQQRDAYPYIITTYSSLSPAETFGSALAIVRKLNWNVIATDAVNEDESIIESTQSSFWFGFTDDIVIRIQAAKGGSKIVIRSVSREGVRDIGPNAKRIKNFIH